MQTRLFKGEIGDVPSDGLYEFFQPVNMTSKLLHLIGQIGYAAVQKFAMLLHGPVQGFLVVGRLADFSGH